MRGNDVSWAGKKESAAKMPKKASLSVLVVLLCLAACAPSPSSSITEPVPPGERFCPPLPAPTGPTISVSDVATLKEALRVAAPGVTILMADGTYPLGEGEVLWVDTPNITLRSASGNREAVVIDGNYQANELIVIAASGVTVADLTLKRCNQHLIHIVGTDAGSTDHTLIYNVHAVDAGQQAIKANPNAGRTHFTDRGVIACSRIELTDAGRPHITWHSCYSGGIDVHWGWGWQVRDNVVEGFWCQEGLNYEPAIHSWSGSRDTAVERNVLIDNAWGIGFGLQRSGHWRTYEEDLCPGAQSIYVGHYGGIIRNNIIIVRRPELFASPGGFACGICLRQACGAQVLHNTIVSTGEPTVASIEWRYPNSDVTIVNNLVSHNIAGGALATAVLSGNVEYAALSHFVDGAGGDVHLVTGASMAIDQGVRLAPGVCDEDVDGDPRPWGSGPDVGADEYVAQGQR